jgi:hypothetical protein
MELVLSERGLQVKEQMEQLERDYPYAFTGRRWLRFNRIHIITKCENRRTIEWTDDDEMDAHLSSHQAWLKLWLAPPEKRVTRSDTKRNQQ